MRAVSGVLAHGPVHKDPQSFAISRPVGPCTGRTVLKGVPVPGIVVYELGSDSPVRMYIRGAAPVLRFVCEVHRVTAARFVALDGEGVDGPEHVQQPHGEVVRREGLCSLTCGTLPRLGFRTLRLEEFALALERGEAVREFGGGSHPGVLRSQRLVALPVPRRP